MWGMRAWSSDNWQTGVAGAGPRRRPLRDGLVLLVVVALFAAIVVLS